MFRSFLTVLLITPPVFAQDFKMTPEVAAAREACIAGDYGSALTVLRPAAEAGDAIAQNNPGHL